MFSVQFEPTRLIGRKGFFVRFPRKKVTVFVNRRFRVQQFELTRFRESQTKQNFSTEIVARVRLPTRKRTTMRENRLSERGQVLISARHKQTRIRINLKSQPNGGALQCLSRASEGPKKVRVLSNIKPRRTWTPVCSIRDVQSSALGSIWTNPSMSGHVQPMSGFIAASAAQSSSIHRFCQPVCPRSVRSRHACNAC
jgi:hypothetical protein